MIVVHNEKIAERKSVPDFFTKYLTTNRHIDMMMNNCVRSSMHHTTYYQYITLPPSIPIYSYNAVSEVKVVGVPVVLLQSQCDVMHTPAFQRY